MKVKQLPIDGTSPDLVMERAGLSERSSTPQCRRPCLRPGRAEPRRLKNCAKLSDAGPRAPAVAHSVAVGTQKREVSQLRLESRRDCERDDMELASDYRGSVTRWSR